VIPLRSLHPDTSLVQIKLDAFHKVPSDALKKSLAPRQPHCLKTRPDGTILDGHHRIFVLRSRGEEVNDLPREIVTKETETKETESR
jgi:hypothetical protein